MSVTLCCSGCNRTAVQYLFVMLHLQSLQLAPLCSFPLTLILCLMKLSHNTKFKTAIQTLFKLMSLLNYAHHVEEKMQQISYLIGQIRDLTLQSLHLPPQIFFFLIHSLSVTPLFSEVFLKDFYLNINHFKDDEFM